MNKIQGYDVVITKGTPRFRLNNKLIARDSVPIDIQDELISIIQNKDAVRTVEAAPDPASALKEGEQLSLPLEDVMYDEPPEVEVVPVIEGAEFQGEPIELERSPESGFSELELQLIEENTVLKRQLAESNTPVGADNLGVTLLEQYGIYTALAPRDPQVGDIHPFTLKPMNRYDTGLAYTERKKSVGATIKPVEDVPLPQENRKDNGGFPTFQDRTGVSFGAATSSRLQHHQNDPINEEATAEPNLRGTTIRPYW